MKRKACMKFLQMLTIFSIVNNSLAVENIAPQVQILESSIKLELPLPKNNERQKYEIMLSSDLGYICHNGFREREIKDKLFSLQTKVNTIPELEKKLLEKEKPTSFIGSDTWRDIAIGFGIGIIGGFAISKKF